MSPICVIDISSVFWTHYFATHSDVEAYSLTIEKCQWYCEEYARAVIACDGPRLKRMALYPEYKAQRKEKPIEAIDSLRATEQQIASWGVPVLKCEGYEADDLVSAIVAQAWLDEIRIVGSDKDLYALLADNVRLITKRGEIGPDGCVDKFGVRPDQIRDWLALVGDQADNVPGAPGVGPGRARDLLVRFGTLPAIMAATDEELQSVRGVGDKTLAGLRSWDPSLAVSLVTLLDDAPVDIETLWPVAAA